MQYAILRHDHADGGDRSCAGGGHLQQTNCMCSMNNAIEMNTNTGGLPILLPNQPRRQERQRQQSGHALPKLQGRALV